MKIKYLICFLILTGALAAWLTPQTAAAASKFTCQPTSIADTGAKLGEKCGVKDDKGIVIFCETGTNQDAEYLCTTNEYNPCPTNVCLVRNKDKCTADWQCEGGAYCNKGGDDTATVSGVCDVDTGDDSLGGTLGTGSDIRDTARRVINIALGFLGVLVVIMVIYGGALWLTSAGAEEKVTKGKNILVWAALGAILISIAWTITSYILKVGKSMG